MISHKVRLKSSDIIIMFMEMFDTLTIDIFYSILFILFIVQRFVHSRKTKSFQHSVKMNPGKSFLLPASRSRSFFASVPAFFTSPPHKIHFFVGAPSIHHRSVDEGKQWQRDGNETNQGKRRRRLLHVGRRNGKN